jgi:hypothetical protein
MQESGTRPASLLTIPISIIATGGAALGITARKCLVKHGEACKISCWCQIHSSYGSRHLTDRRAFQGPARKYARSGRFRQHQIRCTNLADVRVLVIGNKLLGLRHPHHNSHMDSFFSWNGPISGFTRHSGQVPVATCHCMYLTPHNTLQLEPACVDYPPTQEPHI